MTFPFAAINRAPTLDLPGQLRVMCDFNMIVFARLTKQGPRRVFSVSDKVQLLPVPGRIAVKGTPWTALAEIVPDERVQEVRQAILREDWTEVWRLLPANRHSVYIDADNLGSFVQVRTRRPGDRIRPLGMTHAKKVQDVFVDAHIPNSERASIPLFFSTEHCLWVASVRIDDRVRL